MTPVKKNSGSAPAYNSTPTETAWVQHACSKLWLIPNDKMTHNSSYGYAWYSLQCDHALFDLFL